MFDREIEDLFETAARLGLKPDEVLAMQAAAFEAATTGRAAIGALMRDGSFESWARNVRARRERHGFEQVAGAPLAVVYGFDFAADEGATTAVAHFEELETVDGGRKIVVTHVEGATTGHAARQLAQRHLDELRTVVRVRAGDNPFLDPAYVENLLRTTGECERGAAECAAGGGYGGRVPMAVGGLIDDETRRRLYGGKWGKFPTGDEREQRVEPEPREAGSVYERTMFEGCWFVSFDGAVFCVADAKPRLSNMQAQFDEWRGRRDAATQRTHGRAFFDAHDIVIETVCASPVLSKK